MSDLNEVMAFRVIQYAIVNQILLPNRKKLFRVLDYPFPILGAEETLNNQRVVSVYYAEGDLKKGSIYSPIHDMNFHIDLFVSADAKADLLVLERQFGEDFKQTAYANAMNELQLAERRADALMDELINIVYQLIMRKENDQLGVDRLEPSIDLRIGNRMISGVQKGVPIREDKTNKFVSMEAQMVLKCRANEKVTGQLPIGGLEAIGGGAEFHFDLEINEDTTTKAGVLADTTEN
jgi:hypothetical protein